MLDTPRIVFRATLTAALVCGVFSHPSTVDADDVDNAAGDQVDETQISTQDLILKGIDELINWARQRGDRDTATEGQIYKLQFPVRDEIEESIAIAGKLANCAADLRKHSKLRESRKLLNISQDLLHKIDGDTADWQSAVNLYHSWLDVVCEDYDAALVRLDRIDVNLPRAEEIKTKWALDVRACKAEALAGLCRFQAAEEIYLRLLGQPDDSEQYCYARNMVRAKLAKLYFDMEMLRQATEQTVLVAEYLSTANEELLSSSLRLEFEHTIARLALRKGNRKIAEQRVLIAVDLAQLRWGFESVEYVQSMELLALVRVAQARHYEAINCYEKARDIRSRIFGPEHPSVARVEAEIKLVRSQSASAPLSIVLRGISECLDASPLKATSSESSMLPIASQTQTSIAPISLLCDGKVNLDSQGLLDILNNPILK